MAKSRFSRWNLRSCQLRHPDFDAWFSLLGLNYKTRQDTAILATATLGTAVISIPILSPKFQQSFKLATMKTPADAQKQGFV